MRFALAFFLALPLAAIDGIVVNKTTGKPAVEAPIVLMQLGEGGMMPVGTTRTAADGKFHFEANGGGFLLQATVNGVTYNKMIQAGQTGDVTVEVYDTTKSAKDVSVVQHMMLLEPNDGKLTVSETVVYKNDGNASFADPAAGTFRFYVPSEVKEELQVRVTGPGGMPTNVTAIASGTPGVYKLENPIKPGETRFDVQYALPFGDKGTLKSRVLHPITESAGQTRIVTPSGVSVKGAGIEDLGTEPQTQAQVYALKKPDYEIEIAGTGSLRGLEADESGSPEPQIIPAKILERKWWVVGLSMGALALGFVMLLRKPSVGA